MDRQPMRRARQVVAGTLLATLAGCTAASADRTTSVSLETIVPTQPAVVTTLAPLPTSTTDATTSTTPVAATVTSSALAEHRCSGRRTLRSDAVFGMAMTTDLDGDAVPDRLITYGVPTGDGALRWQARAELANGEPSEIDLPDASGTEVQPLGAIELDTFDAHVGGYEAVLRLDSLADVTTYGFAGIDDDGCLFRFGDGSGNLTAVTIDDGELARHGLRCDLVDGAQQLVALSAASTDGQSFETRDQLLQRVGTELVPAPPLVARASLDGPALYAYSIVQCPGIGVE